MVNAIKAAKSNKANVVKIKALKQTAEMKTVVKKAVVSMKKTSARPVPKKKVAAKLSPAISKSRQLRIVAAALKQEIKNLKNALKIANKRADAVASMSGERDAAVARFLKGWDKKATLSLGKSLRAMKNKKSRK